MKNIITKAIIICASFGLLAACAEDQAFDSGYYSSSYSPNINAGNSGYNRNYQHGNNGYGSRHTSPNVPRANPQPQVNNGYSTSGQYAETTGSYGANGYASSGSISG